MNAFDAWKIFSADHERTEVTEDYLNRFLYQTSREQVTGLPAVSNYLYKAGFRPHYPNHHPFAVCISHDVDHLFNHNFGLVDRAKSAGKDFIKGNWRRTIRYLNVKDPINPNYNLEELLTREAEKKIHSSFYFLSLKESEQDFNYDVEKIGPLLHKISSQGSEIGLHGGHEAYDNKQKLIAEKELLERSSSLPVQGYRNHFLKFKAPETWRNLEQAGFAYDTTYGFPNHPGFRNGMCYPFFPYHDQENRFFNVLEIPLMAMDATFIYYLKWDDKKTLEYLKRMVDNIISVNGVFTLLWHNNYFFEPWNTVYNSIVEYCLEKGAWFPSGIALNEWWRKNDFCSQYSQYGLEKQQ